MDIPLRNPFDLAELNRRVRVESNAKQRDRYRAVRLAIAGEPTGTIMDKLGRSNNFFGNSLAIWRGSSTSTGGQLRHIWW